MRDKLPTHFLQGLLRELQAAERNAARGKTIVDDQRRRAKRLRDISSRDTLATRTADTFLDVIENTQRLLEDHVDLMKREVAEAS
jgi:hypothetical protein